MASKFDVCVKELKKVDNIVGMWEDKDYFSLTSMSEVAGRKGVAGEELLEMTIMALQDMEPEEAADIVLEYKLKDPVSAGIRKNIIKDLLDNDSPWEECADVELYSWNLQTTINRAGEFLVLLRSCQSRDCRAGAP